MHCGYIAIIGKPNVGKSTLLNHILGQKISITSRKPQTTRQQILGITTTDNTQAIYLDTPGLHQNNKNAMNRYMNQTASSVITDVDVIVFMIDENAWTKEDDWILQKINNAKCPVVLVINKIDKVENKNDLLPLIEQYNKKSDFQAIIPIAAKSGKNIENLTDKISQLLPEQPQQFPEDQITDRSQRFLAAEIVREKIMRQTGDEIPYAIALQVEEYEEKKDIVHIGVLIFVDKKNQKSIIIGKNGERLKKIGRQARIALENLLENKVFLRLWVKVQQGWADDKRALSSLGYHD